MFSANNRLGIEILSFSVYRIWESKINDFMIFCIHGTVEENKPLDQYIDFYSWKITFVSILNVKKEFL